MFNSIHNYSITLLAFLLFSAGYAQQGIPVYGTVKVEGGRLDGSVEVLKNGSRDRIKTLDGNGKFDFMLDLNANYTFVFSQNEYVTKKIAFNTNVPGGREEEEFYPFEFQVTLFKQYEGVNFVVFNQPVGKIKYSDEVGDFDYDTDYTKSIQQQLAEVEKEVEKAAKEEVKKEKEKEKDPPPAKPKPKIDESTMMSGAGETTKRKQLRPPPPPPPKRKKGDNIVVLHSYTVGELGYPDLNAYGFINFGDGAGPREITKEQFDEYAKQYHD